MAFEERQAGAAAASLHVVTFCERCMLLSQVLLVADNVSIPLLHRALVHHPNLVGHLHSGAVWEAGQQGWVEEKIGSSF